MVAEVILMMEAKHPAEEELKDTKHSTGTIKRRWNKTSLKSIRRLWIFKLHIYSTLIDSEGGKNH